MDVGVDSIADGPGRAIAEYHVKPTAVGVPNFKPIRKARGILARKRK